MNTSQSELGKNKKVYFASDFHLGIPNHQESLKREKLIVRWLDEISKDAQAIFLVGDVFDFWFEYKQVIPKGFVRLLGKLAEIADQGIEIIVFSGNHDLWLKNYLVDEIGVQIYHESQSYQIDSHSFYIAHGDGLGPGDRKFKFFKKIFKNQVCQWLFRWLHPDIGVAMAKRWSNGSRLAQLDEPLTFHGESEWLMVHSKQVESSSHHDYYVYGHRHIAGVHDMEGHAVYINLGEWVTGSTYGVYDGNDFQLKTFMND
ncbi:MAG: UDP-2,3-diacylglucosamine diphosphatase [Reichenbachiella sp.]|uniref:UDP-2,3-diacylglucosamine diphosphatase n=2 Tax=Reichenbachiella sp. TaxID=2184521 RepID=UPI0032978AE9